MSTRTWVASIALGLIAMPALAADDQGFYAGAGAGEFSIDFSGDLLGTPVSFSDSDTAFRVFGGWQFNEFVALEAGYVDGGTASETLSIGGSSVNVDIDMTGFDLMLRGTLPMGESFYGFAQAGMIFWDADLSATSGGSTARDSDSGDDFAYGAGFGFNFSDNAGVRAEYVVYDISDVDVDSIMASFLWKFR